MSRYCLISGYKKLLSSANNLKEKCLKAGKLRRHQESCYFVDEKTPNKILDKVIVQISKISLEFQNTSKVFSAIPSRPEERKSFTHKNLKTKHIKKLLSNFQKQLSQNKNVLWTAAGVSAVDVSIDSQPDVKTKVDNVVDPIPEPPPIPQDLLDESVTQLNALGEPTLESLGLGGYSPVGLAQKGFEFLHVQFGLEWWAAIAVGTIIIRFCLFPLVVLAQRNAAKMNNILPQMQVIQMKMTEARQSGNQLDAARYAQELYLFMKEKQVNPLKNMAVPMAQMPVFVSVFMGLRGMTNVPIDSLRTGGMLWFTDLTISDQYFLLPIITSATLYLTVELGTDTAKMSAQNGVLVKYVLRALPIVVLPFTVNFPGAILCYWASSNFISLLQVGFLRIPRVRDFFKIDRLIAHDPSTLPAKPKGFREGVKETWTNMKISKEIEERRRLDELRFQRAGKGPIVKTYNYDPTKQTEPVNSSSVSAKKG